MFRIRYARYSEGKYLRKLVIYVSATEHVLLNQPYPDAFSPTASACPTPSLESFRRTPHKHHATLLISHHDGPFPTCLVSTPLFAPPILTPICPLPNPHHPPPPVRLPVSRRPTTTEIQPIQSRSAGPTSLVQQPCIQIWNWSGRGRGGGVCGIQPGEGTGS